MIKVLKYFFISMISFCLYSCSEVDAKESETKTKSNAFDKIDQRDKKLFTQEERIESYNRSVNKSESLKKSLTSTSNAGYSGYGSNSTKNKNKEKISGAKKTQKISKPKMTNAGFSAYSTN